MRLVAHLAVLAASVLRCPGQETPQIAIPQDLDCSHQPEWDTFRRAAVAHAQRGWPDPVLQEGLEAGAAASTRALFAKAKELKEKWLWVVCTQECRTSQDLRFRFVEEWGAQCHSSGHFDRYLVTHYFRNRNLSYDPKPRSDYCHYGFLTAVVLSAQAEFASSVAQAQRLLMLAFTLLGDFFSLDWLASSGWPVSSMMVSLNLRLRTQHLIVGEGLEAQLMGSLPGEDGPDILRRHSRWRGTSEAAKGSYPLQEGSWPELVIWQVDGHPALAGEAKTMFTRFREEIGVNVTFIGNSLAQICGNYRLCPERSTAALIQSFLNRYYEAGEDFASVASAFSSAMEAFVRPADVLMCGQPLFWCRFLQGLGKALLFYAGLPVMWAVREEDRAEWGADFGRMLRSEKHSVVAESVFMARELHWQYGTRVPVMRLLGLHTLAMHVPLKKDSVLVSRFGTSGALSECIFSLFLDANPWFPLRFEQLEAILFQDHLKRTRSATLHGASTWERHTMEIKVEGMPYDRLAQHRAAVCMPYDTTIFLFNELYSTNMPIFVPRDLWRWLIGLHTSPAMMFRMEPLPDEQTVLHDGRTFLQPEHSPFYASGYHPMLVDQAVEWSTYTDWALLPHVRYFRGVPELFLQLLDSEALAATSSKMKAFNDEEIVTAVANWKQVARRLLFASRLGVT